MNVVKKKTDFDTISVLKYSIFIINLTSLTFTFF